MAGVALRFDLSQLSLAAQDALALGKVKRGPILDEIGEYLISETLTNFDKERSPDGTPWKQSQRAIEEGGKTLQDKGHLRDSYTHQRLNGSALAIGSNLIYAAIHHFGGSAGRNRSVDIEARPAMGLTPAMNREIGDIALSHIGKQL